MLSHFPASSLDEDTPILCPRLEFDVPMVHPASQAHTHFIFEGLTANPESLTPLSWAPRSAQLRIRNCKYAFLKCISEIMHF